MKKELKTYAHAKKDLLQKFDCQQDLPVRILMDTPWRIEENDGMSFLYYIQDAEEFVSVIVNKNGTPWVSKCDGFTMAVAIDCLRFAFILKNESRQNG